MPTRWLLPGKLWYQVSLPVLRSSNTRGCGSGEAAVSTLQHEEEGGWKRKLRHTKDPEECREGWDWSLTLAEVFSHREHAPFMLPVLFSAPLQASM